MLRLRFGRILALGVAAGLLLAIACGGPAYPTPPPVDCTGAVTSADSCNVATSLVPIPSGPDLPCPTPHEVEEIRREIRVAINNDVSAGVLACRAQDGSVDLTIVENNVYQSLLFLKRMRFDRPLPWTSLSVYDWVRSASPDGIAVESTGNSRSCLNCVGPIVVVYTSYQSIKPTVFGLIHGLIVHEARHAQGWPHTCGFNEQLRQMTRDKTVAEMGGYGVHYSLEYWLGHYSTESQSVRDYYAAHAAKFLGSGTFCCECGRG